MLIGLFHLLFFFFQETVSTCRFAQRVALIKNYLKLNLETDINSENALLKAENERLKQQIKALTMQTVQYFVQRYERSNENMQVYGF